MRAPSRSPRLNHFHGHGRLLHIAYLIESPDRTAQAHRQVHCAELELELIQSHMAQKPVLRSKLGARVLRREVSVERGGMGERGCARRLGGWVWV